MLSNLFYHHNNLKFKSIPKCVYSSVCEGTCLPLRVEPHVFIKKKLVLPFSKAIYLLILQYFFVPYVLQDFEKSYERQQQDNLYITSKFFTNSITQVFSESSFINLSPL